ncbi:MAG: hypothetical protein HUU54_16675 [Ignavibacteriaceae bacterium]|nr:hypothetical protein [Ignavibacteriaceae bacterium]
MSRKLKNTVFLLVGLVILFLLGYAYIYFFQRPKIKDKNLEINNLRAYEYDINALTQQLKEKQIRVVQLDSILAARKYIIPQEIIPLRFYEFMNGIQTMLSPTTRVNIEFKEKKEEQEFFYFEYSLTGVGSYGDVYKLIYAIEQSKELKKIKSVSLNNFIQSTEDTEPEFLVSFNLTVAVYFATNNRFTTEVYSENDIRAPFVYDIFFPLIQTAIPPNLDGLLDVQGARLLALVPEGAFISNISGESYLLTEGDRVYLGYLTKVDYKNNTVRFILNKGGIVETKDLYLEKEILQKAN